jgi:hypothetical protein
LELWYRQKQDFLFQGPGKAMLRVQKLAGQQKKLLWQQPD